MVLQADAFNRSSLQTVIVVPMTTTARLAAAPGNVKCKPRDTGLPKPSVANVSQLSVIDRGRLDKKAGAMPGTLLKQVEDGVRLVLGM
jgi:mRNA interferase MazF